MKESDGYDLQDWHLWNVSSLEMNKKKLSGYFKAGDKKTEILNNKFIKFNFSLVTTNRRNYDLLIKFLFISFKGLQFTIFIEY